MVMVAAPSAAIDLPLRLMVWADTAGAVWVSCNSPSYLATRNHLADVSSRLQGSEAIPADVASPAG